MSCISETCCDAQCVKKLMRSAMYLSSYHDICDIYHQNSMTEINSFDIYSWHKQLTYDTCQEIILPTTWKKSPSGWPTPEIILLNDLKTHQKWGLAFPMPLIILYFKWTHLWLHVSDRTPFLETHGQVPGLHFFVNPSAISNIQNIVYLRQ